MQYCHAPADIQASYRLGTINRHVTETLAKRFSLAQVKPQFGYPAESVKIPARVN